MDMRRSQRPSSGRDHVSLSITGRGRGRKEGERRREERRGEEMRGEERRGEERRERE